MIKIRTQGLSPKFRIYKYILIIIIGLIGYQTQAQTDTISLVVTPVDSAIGMCLENRFSATFLAEGQHFFTIHAELFRDTVLDTIYFCSDPIVKPKLLIVFDTATTTLLSQSTDTAGGRWTGEINTTDSVTIWYYVYLDCSSIIPPFSDASNLNLRQTFTDSLDYFYDTGLETNIHLFENIPGLRIIADDNPIFPSSYLDTTFLTFYYINSDQGEAEISFSFTPDTGNYCNMVDYDSLEYTVGVGGGYQPLTASTLTTTQLFGGDTLIIRHRAVIDTCIIPCSSASVFFQWQCAQPPSMDSIFCNNCTEPIQTSFTIQNINEEIVRIERITPSLSEAEFDNSCFNDTSDMVDWHFRLTNNGIGAIDSVWVNLFSNDSIQYLSLLPNSSFSVQDNCGGCLNSHLVTPRVSYLCNTFIPDAIRSASFQLKNFSKADTVDIRFQTFRCASEDTALFSFPKSMNNWKLKVESLGICNDDTGTVDLFNTPFFGITDQGNISSHPANNIYDVTLNYQYNPVVSDLTVPHDSTFGQSAALEINLNGGIHGRDRQILGCLSGACPQLNGYLKAEINTQQGLVIRNPGTDVRLKLFNDSSNAFLYLNPEYYYTLVPQDTCLPGTYTYYFDLSNPAFLYVLDSGIFDFNLQSCCDQLEPTWFNVSFSLLPNPDSCNSLSFPSGNTLAPVCTNLGCAWIPLKKIEDDLNIHCPGCVTPGMIELPQINEKFINQVTVQLLSLGIDSIAIYYNQVLEIAQQCPTEGGPSVYRARTLASLINDSISFEFACNLSGSNRNSSKVSIKNLIPEITIIPNPAKNKISIVLSEKFSGVCQIEIFNSLGEIELSEERNCNQKLIDVNTNSLSPGAYTIKVQIEENFAGMSKLIIIR